MSKNELQAFVEWLNLGLDQPDRSNTGLAKALGIPQSRVAEMRAGKRKPQAFELKRISEYLEQPPPQELTPNTLTSNLITTVPLVGYVGAGKDAHFYDGADNPNEEVEAPPGSTKNTVAVEVRGTSLGPMFEQVVVFYDAVCDPPRPEIIRRLCVVGLTNGQVLIKKVLKGTQPGRYHLLSNTEGMIEDADIKWAAIVKSMVPR